MTTTDASHQPQSTPINSPPHAENWERGLLEQIAVASLKEQKLNRRWNIFFRSVYLLSFLFFILAIALIASVIGQISQPQTAAPHTKKKGHTALIEINGAIAADGAVSADSVITALRAAVRDKNTKGIILRANSPGGSPVESAYIYDEILQIRKEFPAIKVYTVVKDGCFSGCYYIASASDEIYANRQSLLGSIGVIYMGFGFPEIMQKIGVEPRIITSGDNKAFLNSFAKLNPKHKEHMEMILKQTHNIFIADVKKGRRNRLKDDKAELFSGLVWNAEQGKELGLIDAFGSSSYVARVVIGAETIVDFTQKPAWWRQVFSDVESSVSQKLLNAGTQWKIIAQ